MPTNAAAQSAKSRRGCAGSGLRISGALLCLVLGSTGALKAHAQAPNPGVSAAPITLIVPSDETGSAGRIGRVVAEALARHLHASVRVRHLPGLSGVTGTNAIAAAAPDGATLGLAFSTPMIGAKLLSRTASYNPLQDFEWLALFGTYGYALVVRADDPARTFDEWLTRARAAHTPLRYGSNGIASAAHIAGEYLRMQQHANLAHTTFATSSQGYAALAAGDINALFDGTPSAIAAANARQYRVLAVTSGTRDPLFAQTPAFGETFAGQHFETWVGIVAPAGLKPAARERLVAGIGGLLADAALRARLAELGITWLGLSGPGADQFVRDDIVRKAQQIANVGIQSGDSPPRAPSPP
ncbi:MAG: tripartite tricarboxylate transporter substrate binding protein [Casimicrobiaceae bacterium]